MPVDVTLADVEGLPSNGTFEPAVAVVGGITYVIMTDNNANVTVYSVSSTGELTQVFNYSDDASVGLSYAPSAGVYQTGGVTYVYTLSQSEGLTTFTLAADGSLTPVGAIVGTAAYYMELDVVTSQGVTYLVASGAWSGNGASLYTIGGDGRPILVETIVDDADSALIGGGQSAVFDIGGVAHIAMLGAGQGLTVVAVEGGHLVVKDFDLDYDGQSLTQFYGLAGATVGGTNYVVTKTGTDVVVFSVASDGTLSEVSKIAGTGTIGSGIPWTFLDTFSAGGVTYVVGGQNTELVVYSLSASGVLTLVDSLDNPGVWLMGPRAFTVGGNTIIVAADASGGGVRSFLFDPGLNTITGTPGNDILNGTPAEDLINGLAGNDKITAGASNDTVNGGDGNDAVQGEDGDDTLNGDAGADKLQGGNGDDTLNGGDDNDTLIGGEGDDDLDGGAGNDLVQGGNGNDDLLGGTGDDRLEGGAGNDTFNGGDGADLMIGGTGDDTYYDVKTTDTILEAANGGYDVVETSEASYTLSDHIEQLTMLTGSMTGIGNLRDNVILGNDGVNEISGMGGNDRLYGQLGADTLDGGDGSDQVWGGDDNDIVRGGAGHDSVYGDDGDDIVDGDAGDDYLVGGAGLDTVRGGVGNDYILSTADGWADLLQGGDGNDIIDTDDASDILEGGAGDDTYLVSISKLAAPIGKALPLALLPTITDTSGTDTVWLYGSVGPFQYTMGAGIENLQFQGATGSLAIGNGLNNTITGTSNGATLRGEGGNDTLIGGGSSVGNEDILIGGDGDDTYILGNADTATTITETSTGGVDTVINQGRYVVLAKYVENLTISEGNDGGGEGNGLANILRGSNLGNRLFGMDGNDTIYGNGGGDEIDGGAGDDLLFGGDGDDQVRGGDGHDTIDGGAGINTLIGGQGNDIYKNVRADDVIVENRAGGDDTVIAITDYTLGENLEHLTLVGSVARVGIGNSVGNIIKGNALANTLSGLGGNDTIDGAAGADDLDGGDGDDALRGGADNDSLHGGEGRDDLRGDGGDDFVEGGDNADVIDGGEGDDELHGDAGNDILKGGAGEDHLYGGADADVLDGGAGYDVLAGGAGSDTYYITLEDAPPAAPGEDGESGRGRSFTDSVVEYADEGIDTVYSTANIRVLFDNVENLVLTGSAVTGGGNDLGNKITGNSANNSLFGFGGSDVIDGGTGNDRIVGGAGNDSLTGGKGSDTFVFDHEIGLSTLGAAKEMDVILDFNFAQGDVIDLSGLDANALVSGHQTMLFVDAFTKAAGEATLVYSAVKNTTTLSIDVDGDGKADFQLVVNGNHALDARGGAPKGWLMGDA